MRRSRNSNRANATRRYLSTAILVASVFIRGSFGKDGDAAKNLEVSAAATVAPDCARNGRQLQRHPACAFGKTVYLVAWCDGSRQIERPTADIYCARVEARTGKILDPAGIRVCAAADLQEWPAVAFDGKNFLVVWQDLRNGTDYEIYAARVGENGEVLDPDGFAVSRRAANQARPAVAFAGGRYVVAWMDARQYPVYGLYATRITPNGKVLDTDGCVLDAQDPSRIAEAMPAGSSWLGDRHYWWDRLSSRFQPVMASDGKVCCVSYLRDVHANRTTGHVLTVDPATCAVIGEPVALSGEPRARVASCSTPNGWVLAFDHWLAGWTPVPRLAGLRLDAQSHAPDTVPQRLNRNEPEPANLLDVHKALAGEGGHYHQGKGHFAFWQTAAAWNGGQTLVAMDYGWRAPKNVNELHYSIVVARFDWGEGGFVNKQPLVCASGSTGDGISVRRPALAAGPDGETLLVYEKNAGIDRLTIECRMMALGAD